MNGREIQMLSSSVFFPLSFRKAESVGREGDRGQRSVCLETYAFLSTLLYLCVGCYCCCFIIIDFTFHDFVFNIIGFTIYPVIPIIKQHCLLHSPFFLCVTIVFNDEEGTMKKSVRILAASSWMWDKEWMFDEWLKLCKLHPAKESLFKARQCCVRLEICHTSTEVLRWPCCDCQDVKIQFLIKYTMRPFRQSCHKVMDAVDTMSHT